MQPLQNIKNNNNNGCHGGGGGGEAAAAAAIRRFPEQARRGDVAGLVRTAVTVG